MSGSVAAHPVVRLDGLVKRFGSAVALESVSLEIEAATLVTLLGPSGCGKTTLLRILAGFEQPSEGTVEIDRRDMRRVPPERRPVNLIFQRYALFPHRNVLENVLFGLEAARVGRSEALARAREALALCRMEAFEHRRIDELSGGQAQRVAVARALVNRPRVLLLDEPLAALDLKLRRHLQFELRRLQQELEMTFVYVTHDQGEALTISDSIVLMHEGRVIQHSAPRDLYESPRSVFAATFVGEANVLGCVVQSVRSGRASVRVGTLALDGRDLGGLSAGQAASLCIRPEHVRIGPAPGAAGGLRATVADVVFQGPVARYWLTVEQADASLVADMPVKPGQPLVAAGASVTVEWDSDAAIVLAA